MNFYKYLVQKDEFPKKKVYRHVDFLKCSKWTAATLYKWKKKSKQKNSVFTVKTGETKQQVQRIKNKTWIGLSLKWQLLLWTQHRDPLLQELPWHPSKEKDASLQHLTRKLHCSINNTTVDVVKRMQQWRIAFNSNQLFC